MCGNNETIWIETPVINKYSLLSLQFSSLALWRSVTTNPEAMLHIYIYMFCWANRLPKHGMVLRLKTGNPCVVVFGSSLSTHIPICSTIEAANLPCNSLNGLRKKKNWLLWHESIIQWFQCQIKSIPILPTESNNEQTSHRLCVVLFKMIHQPSCQHFRLWNGNSCDYRTQTSECLKKTTYNCRCALYTYIYIYTWIPKHIYI